MLVEQLIQTLYMQLIKQIIFINAFISFWVFSNVSSLTSSLKFKNNFSFCLIIAINELQSLIVKLSNSTGNNDIATTINSITNSGNNNKEIKLHFAGAQIDKTYALSNIKFA
ncbi:hypothetical protein, partial [Mycoplasmopsis cricetuli]|uniref:hypothetical protein n=1 Tax=Mycoplasmopsis cricetuli TaxID=171283 RepID=UPI00055DBE89